MVGFKKTTNGYGFNYIFEKRLTEGEELILKMPSVSANKRGINDIGWQSDGDITLLGTLSSRPQSDDALWQEIKEFEEVNKTVSALKIINNSTACNIVVRVILN